MTDDLQVKLDRLRQSRKYAAKADDDYEQARESVLEDSADLLEGIAEVLIKMNQPPILIPNGPAEYLKH